MRPIPMGLTHRQAALERLGTEQFDVLVVGGGIVGAGAALDAASRGLSVALVEARDWASGTSSRTSKLIHGGLRYLEQGDLALVREALKERSLLITRLAPHLVRPVAILLPLRGRVWERAYIGAGLVLYDLMAGGKVLPRHRHLGRRRAHQQAPGLRPRAMVGAIQYHDAQMDDARYALAVVRTAVAQGATAASGVQVERFVIGSDGRVSGASVVDAEGGSRFDIRAKAVISATGVWTDDIQRLLDYPSGFQVRASKGVHLVVPRDRIDLESGLILRTETSVLFVLPWETHWLIGTTDTEWEFDKTHPAATDADIDYLLQQVNAVLETPIARSDIAGVYAGLRPLVSGDTELTVRLSREHAVVAPAPGLTVIAGGKFTTYRIMAKDAVDVTARGLDTSVPESVTDRLPLLGADGFVGLWHRRHSLADSANLPVSRIERLLRRYGWCATELLDLIASDADLGRPIFGAEDYLRAEVIYAVNHEDARHLDDVLTRRTRIFMETSDRGAECAAEIARLMARVLGWDERTEREEIRCCLDGIEADRQAQRQPDDRSANAVRQRTGRIHASGPDEDSRPVRPADFQQADPAIAEHRAAS